MAMSKILPKEAAKRLSEVMHDKEVLLAKSKCSTVSTWCRSIGTDRQPRTSTSRVTTSVLAPQTQRHNEARRPHFSSLAERRTRNLLSQLAQSSLVRLDFIKIKYFHNNHSITTPDAGRAYL
jgi:hypothetical protein